MRPGRPTPPVPGPRRHDPELDASTARPPVRLDPDFSRHQRLVANPFLALAALVPWFAAVRLALLDRNLPLVLLLLAGLAGIACLLQFHCLDCGTTGSLFRWRGHACEGAVARQLTGRARRLR